MKLREKKMRNSKKKRGRPRIKDSFSDAVRRRNIALAGIRELELGQKSGELVKVTTMVKERAELGRLVRDGILAVPPRICYVLAAETDPKKVAKIMRTELCAALTVIANNGMAEK